MKDDSSWKVRAARIRDLGALGKDAPLALLTQALHDPDETVREVAVWTLYRLGEHAPVPALLEACSDESELVRAAALESIGNLDAFVPFAQLLMKLQQGLDDESDLVREATIHVIGKLEELASRLNTTEIATSHTFTLIFRGGAIAVLQVHGASDEEEARTHASLVLPSLSCEVVDGDTTNGHAQPFHTWICAQAQEEQTSLLRNGLANQPRKKLSELTDTELEQTCHRVLAVIDGLSTLDPATLTEQQERKQKLQKALARASAYEREQMRRLVNRAIYRVRQERRRDREAR